MVAELEMSPEPQAQAEQAGMERAGQLALPGLRLMVAILVRLEMNQASSVVLVVLVELVVTLVSPAEMAGRQAQQVGTSPHTAVVSVELPASQSKV